MTSKDPSQELVLKWIEGSIISYIKRTAFNMLIGRIRKAIYSYTSCRGFKS